jgi:hypothetical protein
VVLVVGTHEIVAPAEGSGEIVHKSHVVEVVVVSTGPEGEDVLERPGEIVSAVSIDGLEETKNDPDVHGEDVEVSSAEDVKNRTSYRSGTEDEDLSGVGVLGSQAEGSRVFVVNFVNMLVHGTPVEGLMGYQTWGYKPLVVVRKRVTAYRRSGTCLRKRRKTRPGERFPSKLGRGHARCSFRDPRRLDGTAKSRVTRQNTGNESRSLYNVREGVAL